LKKRAKALEKEKKAAEKAAKQQEMAQQQAAADVVRYLSFILHHLLIHHSRILRQSFMVFFPLISHKAGLTNHELKYYRSLLVMAKLFYSVLVYTRPVLRETKWSSLTSVSVSIPFKHF
jgi:hypothetical protein